MNVIKYKELIELRNRIPNTEIIKVSVFDGWENRLFCTKTGLELEVK